MKYADRIKLKHLTPAGLPVAAIPDRDAEGNLVGVIDIYPMKTEDIFWLIQRAPAVVGAFGLGESREERVAGIARAASQAGIEVLQYLLARALGTTVDVIQEDTTRSLEFDVDVLESFFSHGVPESFFDKLVGGLNAATGGKAKDMLMGLMWRFSSANTSPTSSTHSQESTTPTS